MPMHLLPLITLLWLQLPTELPVIKQLDQIILPASEMVLITRKAWFWKCNFRDDFGDEFGEKFED